jgi:hypothetical protein
MFNACVLIRNLWRVLDSNGHMIPSFQADRVKMSFGTGKNKRMPGKQKVVSDRESIS